jgi:hypothetical protein
MVAQKEIVKYKNLTSVASVGRKYVCKEGNSS